jgi:UDP-N-acetylmuramate-alanine ligase
MLAGKHTRIEGRLNLMKMPRNIGPVHFIGIGGIGMSGIAEILHNQGYVVQGSDAAANPNVQRLQSTWASRSRSARAATILVRPKSW